MTAEKRATQYERRRLQYKRRMESMNNEQLAAEKQRRHEQYLRRRYGAYSSVVYPDKKRKNINMPSVIVQEGASSAAEWIVGKMNDENKSRQTLDVTYNQIPEADAVGNYNPCEIIGKNGLQQGLNVNHKQIADLSALTKHDKTNSSQLWENTRTKDQHLIASNQNNDNRNKDKDGESQPYRQRSEHIKINQPIKTTTEEAIESCCTFESRGCTPASADIIPNVTADDIN